MASSILHSIARAVAAGVAAAVTMACPALGASTKPPAVVTDKVTDKPAATLAQSQLPISIDASSSEFDYGKNRLVFHKVTITQGMLRVEAGEATGTDLNFDNSKWQFVGDVHITMEHGSLDSDRADVTFASHNIARAVIHGTPATFEQALEKPPQIARGHANVIEYDVANGTVRLAESAWLSDGENELSGAVLVYDIRAERVVANAPAAGEERVRITINPQKRKPAVPAVDPSK
jgi:lipopolysaccharide transport protein LptA